jgi:D-galactarolactone cycloisomerase
MKIENFETYHIGFPFETGGPYSWGKEVWECLGAVLLKVNTDEAIDGWGEAWGLTDAKAANDVLRNTVGPSIVGLEVGNITDITHMLLEKYTKPGFSSAAMQAISAVDIALWDIVGKAAGVPLHELFGDAGRQSIPFYASLFRYENPEIVSERAAAAKAEGYTHIKLHEDGEEEISAARNTLGPDFKLMIDVNGAWEGEEVIQKIERFNTYDAYWFEEPISPKNDFESMAQLRSATGASFAAGENAAGTAEFARMIEAGAVNFIQPNVTKAGGITVFREVVELAKQHDIVLIPHSPMFGPGLLASLHLSAGLTDDSISEWLY